MKIIKNFFTRHIIAAPISIIGWLYFILGTNLPFIAATGLFFALYFASSFTVKQIQIASVLKQFGLSRSEYRYITNQLTNAKQKLKQLNSYYGKVRSVQAFRQLHEMNLIARKILNTVQKNPKKFYHVENFFYAHLDSSVELTSKYAMLVNQPLKDEEIQTAIDNTRSALHNVSQQFEQDLRKAIATDIELLNIEIDYVDATMNKSQPRLNMEGEQQHDKSQ